MAVTPELRRCRAVEDSETRSTHAVRHPKQKLACLLCVRVGDRDTCEGAVGSDVMCDETCGEHQQNHEQFGPGEAATSHLHLQILETGRREALRL